ALGQLLLTLGCCGLAPPGHPPSLELLASAAVPSSSASGPGSTLPGLSLRFTPEFSKLVGALLAAPRGGPLGTARQLVAALAERSLVEVEMLQLAQDALVSDLALECENGRLLRLLVKLGFINERPEGDVDASWAETADRYLLKLFRCCSSL
ncbi:PAB-dependent poly(A)-specific ribonuclease subunit 3, partial [Haematococcus lacustris]